MFLGFKIDFFKRSAISYSAFPMMFSIIFPIMFLILARFLGVRTTIHDIVFLSAYSKVKSPHSYEWEYFRKEALVKALLIAIIRPWFALLNRQNELIVIATTGTAAFNVTDTILHSAANLPIGKQIKKKIGRSKGNDWINHHYLIIDEINMMDCRMFVNLHNNLGDAKSSPDDYFDGVNIIFMGDFLQLTTVSQLDVYVDKLSKWKYDH